jgi:RNA polymerase sigma-70 factor (ECF subfamily)
VVDDLALLDRAATGDEPAFELLVRRHTGAVWRYARSFLPDDFAAEEAVQDTFVKAYRGMAAFRGASSVRTWLLSICHRTCIDATRRRRATVVSLDEARRARARDEHHELRLALAHGVGTLPGPERQAFQLVDILGYSREEAAEIVGVPASTMRSRVSRARKRMLAALDEAAAEGER